MTPECALALSYVSQATALVAALALYWAGGAFENPSWKKKDSG